MTLEQEWLAEEIEKDDLVRQIPKLIAEIERLNEEVRALKARMGKKTD